MSSAFGVAAVLWVLLAVLIGYWNKQRGHAFWVGLVASLLLSPLIGVLIVALTGKKTEA